MGSRKVGLTTLFLIVFSSFTFAMSDYEKFLSQQQNSFTNYKKSVEDEFKEYQKAYKEGLKEYKNSILKKWPSAERTTKHKWVQYSDDYKSKKVVDFKNEEIKIEVIAKDEKEAKKKIEQLTKEVLSKSVKEAYKEDKLQQNIDKKLNTKTKEVKSSEKIVADVLTSEQKKSIEDSVKNKKIEKEQFKDKTIYKLNIKLPSTALVKKAKLYKEDVAKNSNKREIPMELIYAIIHSESSFNPMARSHIPAYGLMQIVPKTAGVDTYQFLYGQKKVLSANYLYDSKNNIKIGAAYLHILYYRYLKKIKNPTSRLYCAIAAYNTGAGNVAKAFIGNYNISKAAVKINKMSASEVYNHLLKNLPYLETRKYLVKVNSRLSVYHKLLESSL